MRLALLLLFSMSAVRAQTATVRVTAGAETGVVVIADAVAGAPGEALTIPAATPVVVALVEPGRTWNPRRAAVTVMVPAGDTLDVGLVLPARVRIETMPPGATVTLTTADGTSRVLGAAPVTEDLAPGATGTLVASLDGYRNARATLDAAALEAAQSRPLFLLLSPDGSEEGTPPVTILTTERSRRRATILDASIAVLTLAAGTLAVVTKFQADRLDDRYRDPASPERGDEALRTRAERLDRTALGALGAMQIGVGALAFRLVFR